MCTCPTITICVWRTLLCFSLHVKFCMYGLFIFCNTMASAKNRQFLIVSKSIFFVTENKLLKNMQSISSLQSTHISFQRSSKWWRKIRIKTIIYILINDADCRIDRVWNPTVLDDKIQDHHRLRNVCYLPTKFSRYTSSESLAIGSSFPPPPLSPVLS